MSRRLSAVCLLAVLSLVASGLVSPLVAPVAASYGGRVFQSNAILVPGAQWYPVYTAVTVAQSFSVAQAYLLENVTLRVANNGNSTNPLKVSICPDNPATHVPVLSDPLAAWSEITPNGTANGVVANWTFSPAPLLQAGQTYWIVAQNGAPQSSAGYEWFSTNSDTYAGGHGVLLASGGWAGLPYDLYFLTFGQGYDASLTPAMTVDREQAQPGDVVSFTVHFNNTGSQPAPRVWINDTLPAALTNLSLGFPDLQPASVADFPNLTFADVSNGPHRFMITGQVAIGTLPGSVVTNAVALAFAGSNGGVVRAGPAVASVEVGLVTKQLYLGGPGTTSQVLGTTKPSSPTPQRITITPGSAPVSYIGPALAGSFHARNASATLWLSKQKSQPQTYHLILSLLDNGTPVASFSPSFSIATTGFDRWVFALPVSDYTFGYGHRIGLQITNLGGGSGSSDSLIVAYNGTTNDSQLDLVTDTYVSIRSLSLESETGPTAEWSTLDSLIVHANVSEPFGASRITRSWIAITDPSGHLAFAGSMNPVLTDPSSLPAWELFAYTLSPPLDIGRYHVVVNATEDNGVSTLAEGWAKVSAPAFTLATLAPQYRVEAGQTFPLYVLYNNTGTGTAEWVWINETVPAQLVFVTSNLSVTSVSGSTYTWALTNVSVGSHRLEVDLRVVDGSIDWVENPVTLDFQDPSRHPGATLYSNTSLFLNGPILTLTATCAPSGIVHASEPVTYTIELTNSGTSASAVWVNVTLPPGFAYNATTAETVGGTPTVSGSVVHIAFPGMPSNATWAFDLLALASHLLVRNTSYATLFSVAYTSLRGDPMPEEAVSVALIAASPWIPTGTLGFLRSQVFPGTDAEAMVAFENSGNEPAPSVWVNLSLNPELRVANASLNYSGGTGTVGFVLSNVTAGYHRIYLNFTVSDGVADGSALTLLGTLDAHDGIGNPLPTAILSQANVYVSAAQLSLFIFPSKPRFEAGVPYPLTLSCYNWGTDTASNAWLNLTLPAGLEYVNDTSPAPPSVSSSGYTWRWTNLTPGRSSVQLYLRPRGSVPDGTFANLSFHLDYQGSDGHSRPSLREFVNGTIGAPNLLLSVTVDAANAVAGGTLHYTLRIRNAGTTMASTVYLVNEVDPWLQVVTYDATVEAAVNNQTYNWTFPGLAPGASEVVNLTVRLADGVPAGTILPLVFEATYTNSVGGILGRVRSSPVTVGVVTDYTFLAWIGLGVGAAAVLAYAFLQRRRVEIEDVFLVYRDGVLISHLSRSLLREKDEDVLSGMLTAVQEFVREAFQYGEHRDLQQLDFGDYRILIERGTYVFLAVVYSGKESLALRKKVRGVIGRIEDEFGKVLEKWDGDMAQMIGARDVIRTELLGTANHNHGMKASSEQE